MRYHLWIARVSRRTPQRVSDNTPALYRAHPADPTWFRPPLRSVFPHPLPYALSPAGRSLKGRPVRGTSLHHRIDGIVTRLFRFCQEVFPVFPAFAASPPARPRRLQGSGASGFSADASAAPSGAVPASQRRPSHSARNSVTNCSINAARAAAIRFAVSVFSIAGRRNSFS